MKPTTLLVGGGVLISVTSNLTSERIYFPNPNDIELVGVKVFLQSSSIFVNCSYIQPGSEIIIYEHHFTMFYLTIY